MTEEQADTEAARVTPNEDDVESLRLDRGANSERIATSLLDALTRSTQRDGELLTATVRLTERMIRDRDVAKSQDIEFVLSTDNVPKCSNRRLP